MSVHSSGTQSFRFAQKRGSAIGAVPRKALRQVGLCIETRRHGHRRQRQEASYLIGVLKEARISGY